MNHLSIDIETLGTKPGSVILSVGFLLFDPFRHDSQESLVENGDEIFLDLEEQTELGLTTDSSTIMWWMRQDVTARKHQFEINHIRVRLVYLSDKLSQLMGEYDVRDVWANGPASDMVLLEHAFRKANAYCPWKYNWGRDIRTLTALTGKKPVVHGTAHNALHDAAAQAQFVQECYAQLKIGG